MEHVQFGPEVAFALATKVRQARMSGAELSSFAETEPALASECGVEIAALEARTILSGQAIDRVLAAADQAAQLGRPFMLHESDVRTINRLEGVISLASGRIAQRYMALDGAESGVSKLGAIVSVVSGVAGLVRSFF